MLLHCNPTTSDDPVSTGTEEKSSAGIMSGGNLDEGNTHTHKGL